MALNWSGGVENAAQYGQVGSMGGPKGAAIGATIGFVKGLFSKDKDKPATPRRRKKFEVSQEEINAFLPPAMNIPGYVPYKPGKIVVGKGTKRWQEAEKIRLLNLEAAKARNALAAAQYGAARSNIGEQLANVDQQAANIQGYGDFERAMLDRNRLQNIASQNANLRRRRLQNTTLNSDRGINFDYSLANMALNQQIADRRNAISNLRNTVLQQQKNLDLGIDSPAIPFSQMAQYGLMPGQLAGAQSANQLAAQQAYGATRNSAQSNALGNLVTAISSLRNPGGGGGGGGYLPFNPFNKSAQTSPPEFASAPVRYGENPFFTPDQYVDQADWSKGYERPRG